MVKQITKIPVAQVQSSVFVVDDDRIVCNLIMETLEDEGRASAGFASCEAFLDAYHPDGEECLIVDAYLPGGMDGISLLQRLRALAYNLPTIVITARSDVPMAVRAMKAGGSNFLTKPVRRSELLDSIDRALEQSRDANKLNAFHHEASLRIAALTPRQRRIMELVLAGHPSKNIAANLGISQRTVENHRAAVMKKMQASSIPGLARLALAAVPGEFPEKLQQQRPRPWRRPTTPTTPHAARFRTR
jgi:two-component system CheB/CheR fusion protein